jgi:hypothetical protein
MAFLAVSPRDESEHDRCLKNIGKLEMELFPDLPKDLRWAKWPGKTGWGEPGQIIAINPGEKIEWLETPALASASWANYQTEVQKVLHEVVIH